MERKQTCPVRDLGPDASALCVEGSVTDSESVEVGRVRCRETRGTEDQHGWGVRSGMTKSQENIRLHLGTHV